MVVLGLDTTGDTGSVAVWRTRTGLVAERSFEGPRAHSVRLPGELLACLHDADLRLEDVDAFGVATGPGSLTGLRVGIATAQGLALALGRPLVAITTLEALAAHALPASAEGSWSLIGAWINARRGEVFTALYRRTTSAPEQQDTLDESTALVEAPAVTEPTAAAERWAALGPGSGALVIATDTPDGAALVPPALASAARVVVARLLARIVAELAAARLERGAPGSPKAVRPVYLRRPDAELGREQRAVAAGGGAAR